MCGGEDEHEVVATRAAYRESAGRCGVRIVAVARVAERQGDVGAVFADRLDGFGRLGLEVGDGDAGVGDRERREEARDENGRRRRECDQPHEARAQTAQLGEFLRGRLDRQCDGGRVAREHSPGLGETHPRPTRSTTAISSRASRRRRCWLIAGWLYPSAAAAPVIEPVSAIARTIRRLCTSRSAAASVIDTSSHGMHVIE
jgi:hypothetical protein